MSFLVDTNIAIHLRDGDEEVLMRTVGLAGAISFSLATLVELQAGLATDHPLRERRRDGLARLVERFSIVPLNRVVVERYGSIVRRVGFSRTRVFDRLIAATAIVHDLTLVTINGPDFRDVPDLKLEVWPAPAQ